MSAVNGRQAPAATRQAGGARVRSTDRSKPPLPVIHEIAWVSLLLQLAIVGILVVLAGNVGVDKPILAATLIYLILAAIIRLTLTNHQRRGMALARDGQIDEAIPEFQRSYEFFSRYRWLDDWRYLALLSTSKVCYREMALLNMAYCDLWNDHGEAAVRTYLRTVEEFPDSGLAWTGIKLFQAGGHDGERRARQAILAGQPVPASPTAEVSIRGAGASPR